MKAIVPTVLGILLLQGWAHGQLQQGPALPHRLVEDWAQLPAGWNFKECTGVDVDKDDNVWVFNRGHRMVIQFDRNGNVLTAWDNVPVAAAHGLRLDREGYVWLVDTKGHAVMKCTRAGRVKLLISDVNRAGDNDSKYAFNEPTNVAFAANGDFYISDGYVNSRVIRFNKNGEYVTHWGRQGTGDGEFNLVHDVCLDEQGRVYVADRTNARVQIFDASGKFLGKWTDVGAPWGLYYVAREKSIYMADGTNNRVVRLSLDGKVTGVLGGFGKAPGKFDFAHAVAVDSTGAVYVAEIKNWRVQKFAPK